MARTKKDHKQSKFPLSSSCIYALVHRPSINNNAVTNTSSCLGKDILYLFSANYFTSTLLVFHSIEHISQTTLATVLTVKVGGHENSGTTFLSRALPSQSVNFSIVIHTVVLQNCQFDLLVLMFDLFGSGVILLLTFLTTTTKTEHQVKGTLYISGK